jgi:hypothetical protein
LGKDAVIGPLGEKPSQRLIGAGSTRMSFVLIGIASAGTSTRKPVSVEPSVARYADDGHGIMHEVPAPSGLHSAGTSSESPPPPPHAARQRPTIT